MERILHFQSSSLLTALYLMAIMVAREGLLSMLLIMLSIQHLKLKLNILIKQQNKNVLHRNLMTMFSYLISRKFRDLIQNSQLKHFYWVLYQQEQMLAGSHSSSIVLASLKSYAELQSIMLFSQLVMEQRTMQTTGLLKTHGLQNGENKVTSEFLEI